MEGWMNWWMNAMPGCDVSLHGLLQRRLQRSGGAIPGQMGTIFLIHPNNFELIFNLFCGFFSHND